MFVGLFLLSAAGCPLDGDDDDGNGNGNGTGNGSQVERLIQQCEDLCVLLTQCGGDGECECEVNVELMARADCLDQEEDWYDCLESATTCDPDCDAELDASLGCLIAYCEDHPEDQDCPTPPPPPGGGGGGGPSPSTPSP
jgi:hypothetical protein